MKPIFRCRYGGAIVLTIAMSMSSTGSVVCFPLHIAQTAADVAELASEIAICGNPNLSGDATAASLLAASASRVAANLVEINLATVEGDNRVELARALVRSATRLHSGRSATPVAARSSSTGAGSRTSCAGTSRSGWPRSNEMASCPGLATVLVGEDYAAQAYERRVRRLAEEMGCRYTSELLAPDVEEADALALVGKLNADPRISGILLLRPLPPQVSEEHLSRRSNR